MSGQDQTWSAAERTPPAPKLETTASAIPSPRLVTTPSFGKTRLSWVRETHYGASVKGAALRASVSDFTQRWVGDLPA